MRTIIQNIVKEHKATFDENDLRDYTDYFIEEQKRQGEGSTFTGISDFIIVDWFSSF